MADGGGDGEDQELNIHLRLDGPSAAAARALAASLRLDPAVDLAGGTHLPHVTLLLGVFAGADGVDALDRVAALLAEGVAPRHRPPTIALGPPRPKGRYAFWDVSDAADVGALAALAAAVVFAVKPALRPAADPSWLGDLPAGERAAREEQRRVHGTLNSFEFYDPHVTLGYGASAGAVATATAGAAAAPPARCEAAAIFVSALGERGTVAAAARTVAVPLRGRPP